MTAKQIRAVDVKEMLDSGKESVLLDAPSTRGWGESDVKIPGAIRVRVYASHPAFSQSGGISGTGIRVGCQSQLCHR